MGLSEKTEKAQITTPPCPACGHALTAAYDDGDGFWECDGCGRDFEYRDLSIPPENGGITCDRCSLSSHDPRRVGLTPHVLDNLITRAKRDLAEGPYESVSSRIPARMLLSLCEEVAYWRQQAIPPVKSDG